MIERILDHGDEVVAVTLGGATGGLTIGGPVGMGVGAAFGLVLSLAAIHSRKRNNGNAADSSKNKRAEPT